MSKIALKECFKLEKSLEPIYSGGEIYITPQGDYLIAQLGNQVKLTQISTGYSLFTVSGDDQVVTCISVSEKYIFTASRSMQLYMWNMSDGSLVRSWKAHDAPVISMSVDHTGSLLATGSADGIIRVWDIENGYCTHHFKGHGAAIIALTFHPSKWELYSACSDNSIRMWELVSKSCIAVFNPHVSTITQLAVSPCGGYLLSSSRDQTIGSINISNRKVANNMPVFEPLHALAIFNNYIISGGDQGVVKVWDFDSGKMIFKYEIKSVIHSIIVNGNELIVSSEDQHILFFSLPDLTFKKRLVGHFDEIVDMTWVSDSVVAIATNYEQIHLLDTDTMSYQILDGHSDVVLCLANREEMMASGSKDKTIRLWNNKGQCVGVCTGHTESISALAFNHKNEPFLVSAGQDRTIKVWIISNLHSKYTIKAHEKDINSVAVAPNDKVFATGSQDKTAKLWNVEDGSLLGVFRGHRRGIWNISFSPIDKCLVTASSDKTIRLWSVGDFSCLKTFEGHESSVLRVAFINYGTQLISSASNGIIKCWNIKTNECVASLDNHQDKVWSLVSKDEGDLIISGGADGQVSFWRDSTLEKNQQELEQRKEFIIKEQELSNCILEREYRRAIILALELDQPFKMYQLLESINDSMEDVLKEILLQLDLKQIEQILLFIRDWNTHTKKMLVAQQALYVIISVFPFTELLKIKNIRQILQALIPYTEKHVNRMSECAKKTHVLGYIYHQIGGLRIE